MGAKVEGDGTDCLKVLGVRQEELHHSCFEVGGDRIVAGPYMAAVMAATGKVCIRGADLSELREPVRLFLKSGASIRADQGSGDFRISMKRRPRGIKLETAPYPGFPTDLQSPFMAFLAGATGESQIKETVFEERFAAAGQLEKMGARIEITGMTAQIKGVWPLMGANLSAGDLRGGAALVVAALGAGGWSIIRGCRHIERGYEDICRDLSALGADICWLDGEQ